MPSFQVGTILWAKNRPSDHYNHLHVEPPTRKTGTPPLTNPGMTDGVKAIYDGLTARFGTGYYFTDPRSADADWSHMGGWNRRMIAGTSTWSQHAWWNALDIGPFYGVEEQQRFYDFLTGQETQGGEEDMSVSSWAQASWDWIRGEGIYSESTLPKAEPTNEQLAVFIKRYDNGVQKQFATVKKQIAAAAAVGGAATATVIAEIVNRLS